MELAARILEMEAEWLKDIPQETLCVLGSVTRDLIQKRQAAEATSAGSLFPDAVLPNGRQQPIDLAQLRSKGPLLVSFYRRNWCTYCDLELKAYLQLLPRIREKNATLVAISPQRIDPRLPDQPGLVVLSDRNNQLAESLGLAFTLPQAVQQLYMEFGFNLPVINGDNSWRLPIPATYIVAPNGSIQYAYLNADPRQRAEPELVLRQLDLPNPTTAEV